MDQPQEVIRALGGVAVIVSTYAFCKAIYWYAEKLDETQTKKQKESFNKLLSANFGLVKIGEVASKFIDSLFNIIFGDNHWTKR